MNSSDYGVILFENGNVQFPYGSNIRSFQLAKIGLEMDKVSLEFAKHSLKISVRRAAVTIESHDDKTVLDLENLPWFGWDEYHDVFAGTGALILFSILNRGDNTYDLCVNVEGCRYRIIFGYGIDYGYYMQTHKFNRFKSFRYKAGKLIAKCRRKG